jgi:hypothetical protein
MQLFDQVEEGLRLPLWVLSGDAHCHAMAPDWRPLCDSKSMVSSRPRAATMHSSDLQPVAEDAM